MFREFVYLYDRERERDVLDVYDTERTKDRYFVFREFVYLYDRERYLVFRERYFEYYRD